MPKPKTSVKLKSTSQHGFPVRKRALSRQSGKDLAQPEPKLQKTTSQTELRLRKSDPTASPSKLPGIVSHQPNLQKDEHMLLLKQFDLDYKYGPCAGISRLERWTRAEQYNKHPPVEVKNLVESHQHDKDYNQAIWNEFV